jgi:hypothetical protein
VLTLAVHPLAAVTVNIYSPPIFTVGDDVEPPDVIPGPLQLYVPPPPPVKTAVVDEHVNVEAFVAVATGAVVFCVIEVFAVAIQPLAAVTVNVYVPGKFTVGDDVEPPDVIPGPLQLYVPPPPPVKTAVVVAHVNVELFVAVGDGNTILDVTETVPVVLHPATEAVYVYTPPALTIAVAEVAPDKILGPDQLIVLAPFVYVTTTCAVLVVQLIDVEEAAVTPAELALYNTRTSPLAPAPPNVVFHELNQSRICINPPPPAPPIVVPAFPLYV